MTGVKPSVMRLIVTRGCIEIKMAAKTPFELGEFNSNKGLY